MRTLKTTIICVFLLSNLLAFQNCAKKMDLNEYTNQSSMGTDDPGTEPPPTTPIIVAPSIVSQSPNPAVTEGQSFTLSVSVQGDAPAFQWYKNAVAISGATAASYTVAASAVGDSGSYRVVAVNASGEAAADFTVTVSAAPPPPPTPVTLTMALAPALSRVTIDNNRMVWVPSAVVLSVAATGTNLKYQWYHRGAKYGSYTPPEVAVPNSNSPSLTVNAVYGQGMSVFCGVYRVVISNSLNTVYSQSVTVECRAGGNTYK